jgi:peptidylprolyl isomerase domain and WD repeat-containing protein 1
MHRDNISFVACTKSDFIITASCDGHVKFWKKIEDGIEFVKHFRAHLHPITSLSANVMGTLLCTSSTDKTVKIFDVINFDMINMIKLDFTPSCTCWISTASDTIPCLAVTDADSASISVYDGQGSSEAIHVLEKLHTKPVSVIAFNAQYETVISIDKAGILEYWLGHKNNFAFPEKIVQFDSKLDTSLYEFAKNKTVVTGLACSFDGRKFATISTDRKVRVFQFLTGKLVRVYDEALARFQEAQQTSRAIPNMEFSRRLNMEKEIEKTDSLIYSNIQFDLSGHFIIYSTMIGIKIINIETNKCSKILGKADNLRPMNIAVFQGKLKRSTAAVTIEQEASDNTVTAAIISDPTVFCTGFKKNRFYLYSRRLPSDVQEIDRDVFNEQPTKEEILAVTDSNPVQKIFDNAIIHTTYGDVFMKLFGKECPKTVENFCVHGKNGYYNGHLFHRVIRGFMIQTGGECCLPTFKRFLE